MSYSKTKPMLQIRLIDLVNTVSVFQLAFFSIYILKKGRFLISNKILLLFFLSQFIVILNYLTNNIFGQFQSFQVNTLLFSMPLWFVWGPLMFFYIKSQIQYGYEFKKQDFIHFVPFTLAIILYISYFGRFTTYEKIQILSDANIFEKLKTVCLLVNIHVLLYNVAAYVKLHSYQKKIRNYSSSQIKTDVSWLKFVLISYVLACFCCKVFFFGSGSFPLSVEMQQTIVYFAFMVFFSMLFYKAILNPQVLEQVGHTSNIGASTFDEDEFSEINNKLEQIICEKKPYLNQSLTLKDLSELTDIPERTISQVLNQFRKQTFYTFINSYRIEEAKKLLATSSSKKDTMLGIAFDSGFHSKSVFYEAFKKYVGMTPTEFRQLA